MPNEYEQILKELKARNCLGIDIDTIGIVCARRGRNFIGIEFNEDYFRIAQQCIAKAQQDAELLEDDHE